MPSEAAPVRCFPRARESPAFHRMSQPRGDSPGQRPRAPRVRTRNNRFPRCPVRVHPTPPGHSIASTWFPRGAPARQNSPRTDLDILDTSMVEYEQPNPAHTLTSRLTPVSRGLPCAQKLSAHPRRMLPVSRQRTGLPNPIRFKGGQPAASSRHSRARKLIHHRPPQPGRRFRHLRPTQPRTEVQQTVGLAASRRPPARQNI